MSTKPVRGRPRVYTKTEQRFRLSLPRKVITWLGQSDKSAARFSAPQYARLIILRAYHEAQQRK